MGRRRKKKDLKGYLDSVPLSLYPPEGVHVQIVGEDGSSGAVENHQGHGDRRAVHFKSGTNYKIRIDNKKEVSIAVVLRVDGRQVQSGAFYIRKNSTRDLKGFVLERKSKMSYDDNRKPRRETTTTIEEFHAVRETPRRGPVELAKGNIDIVFLQTKYIGFRHAEHKKGFASDPPRQGNSLPGRLVTAGGNRSSTTAHHAGRGRIVVDRSKPKPVKCGWTIKDRDAY